jgi:hypothetical protein
MVSACDYEDKSVGFGFKCQEPVHNQEATRCIFHDAKGLTI